jgi:DNA-binding CsgD family transcriptional regulator
MHCGGVILNAAGEVISLNPAAERYLHKYAELGTAVPGRAEWTSALRRLLGAGKDHMASDANLQIPIANGSKPRLVSRSRRVPSISDEGALTLVTLVDLTEPALPDAEMLQKLLGLTAAEARLALEIARGSRLRDAAETLGIETPMACSQLTSILAKTGTQHQSELVALLSRLTIV